MEDRSILTPEELEKLTGKTGKEVGKPVEVLTPESVEKMQKEAQEALDKTTLEEKNRPRSPQRSIWKSGAGPRRRWKKPKQKLEALQSQRRPKLCTNCGAPDPARSA